MSPRQAGPTPHRRVPASTKAAQGLAVLQLVLGEGLSFRAAGKQLGLSKTTSWRRYWFVVDRQLPDLYGVKARRLPPQRGTRLCPRGRPWIEELDGPNGPLHRGGIR
ncbi:hypothetical protein ACFV06_31430 [Streptomyces sp. NPDC059618]|uniref:hypothetical protein n=1 Tax=Streptomyces sp. NPDC059618 TaxID=3346887 RepID=UPI0036757220